MLQIRCHSRLKLLARKINLSMKTKDLSNLVSKPISELEKIVIDKKTTLMKSKADIIASREKNLKTAKNLRREISQILTLIRQKEIMEKAKQK